MVVDDVGGAARDLPGAARVQRKRIVVAKSGLRAWRIFDDGRWGEWA